MYIIINEPKKKYNVASFCVSNNIVCYSFAIIISFSNATCNDVGTICVVSRETSSKLFFLKEF